MPLSPCRKNEKNSSPYGADHTRLILYPLETEHSGTRKQKAISECDSKKGEKRKALIRKAIRLRLRFSH